MVLVVDDMAIIRDPIAACLREAGFAVACASSGAEALEMATKKPPQLILLDVAMPEMSGLELLQTLRDKPDFASTPVILLTAVADKETVLQAAKLRVNGYVLKSRFSAKELLERVGKVVPRLNGTSADPGTAPKRSEAPSPPNPEPASSPDKSANKPGEAARPEDSAAKSPVIARAGGADDSIPVLLDREECIRRAREAMQTKALSGVVAQVIALANSPKGDVAQLSGLIGRDPSLSARVLGSANAAAYAAAGTIVTTIPDAVRKIGFSTVRNLAAACGIFDAIPTGGVRGFNPIRCWQHSFAVAQLCETIEQQRGGEASSLAYIVGLCHDLADILVQMHFAAEYRRVLEVQVTTGRPLEELERLMLGMTRHNLVLTVLQSICLPDSIRAPIEAFHRRTFTGNETNRLAGLLRICDQYANSLLLAAGDDAMVAPLPASECRTIFGKLEPRRPDGEMFRSSILGLTATLARLSRAEEAELMKPLYPKLPTRIGLVRDSTFAAFDPIQSALESLAEVQLLQTVPQGGPGGGFQGIVVTSRKSPASSLNVTRALSGAANFDNTADKPVAQLWLVGQIEPGTVASNPTPTQFPVTLKQIAEFVKNAA